MKRRNFTQSVMATLGASSLPIGVSLAAKAPVVELQTKEKITSKDGLVLKLNQTVHPTKNEDKKQFILTYDVKNSVIPLEEKIYQLKVAGGKTHEVFMTPINGNQLQAVFNWRLNA